MLLLTLKRQDIVQIFLEMLINMVWIRFRIWIRKFHNTSPYCFSLFVLASFIAADFSRRRFLVSFLCTGSACGMYSGRWSGAGNYDQVGYHTVPVLIYHCFNGSGLLHVSLWSSVPARWVADPEPAFHLNAYRYPDLFSHLNAVPYLAPYQSHANLRLLVYRPSRAPL
jgi:hypothetical protein